MCIEIEPKSLLWVYNGTEENGIANAKELRQYRT
jgi:hypothetical protein